MAHFVETRRPLFEAVPVPGAEFITYDFYRETLDRIARGQPMTEAFVRSRLQREGLWDTVKGIAGGVMNVFKDIKAFIEQIVEDFKVGITEVVEAFKQKDVWAVLKAFGFNLKTMFKAITAGTAALRHGLFKVFEEISKSGVVQKLRSGAMTIDEFMDQHPALKRVAGPAVAGILLFIWLRMTFIGDAGYDLDLTDMLKALAGHYSLTELFASPAGLMMLTLLATALATGGTVGAVWLGESLYNLILALLYTGLQKARKHTPFWNKLKSVLSPMKR